jgi:glycosyltransferase involved in cell wall biosynthesis
MSTQPYILGQEPSAVESWTYRRGRRPRVLQIGKYYRPYCGGMENHLETLCQQIREAVHLQVIVADHEWRGRRESIEGIDVTRSAKVMNVAGTCVCPAMAWQIRGARPDLVHLHHPNPTAMLAYLSSGCRTPMVLTYHSDIVRQKRLGAAFQPILTRILDECGAIIATSQHYVESSPLLTRYQRKTHIIPLCIPLDHLESDPGIARRIRAHYGPRIILSVGRLVYYKGFEYLIRAMQSVDARLLIVGSGPLGPALEREVAERQLGSRVTLLGEVENVAPYYHACDLFVLPSVARSEAFGIVQLEAMACSKPVVNTRLQSGVPYVSLDGVTGITVPPADPEALAVAMNRLLSDDNLRHAYGLAARRRIEEHFSLCLMASRTLDVYASVLGSSRIT